MIKLTKLNLRKYTDNISGRVCMNIKKLYIKSVRKICVINIFW